MIPVPEDGPGASLFGGQATQGQDQRRSILLIAGEISGDLHAAGLVRAVQRKRSKVDFFGIGGDQLRAAGMDVLFDTREMAVMGLVEVLKRYRFFKNVMAEMLDLVRVRKPDAVVLVDYPGFNLRFAREVKKLGFKVIYYICPQVWAWHRSRIFLMARIVDRLIVIFPFEPAVFSSTNLKVDFVGHPFVDEAKRALAEPLVELPWAGQTRIALLPGSRRQEIERILPPMLGAAARLEKEYTDAGFIIASPSAEITEFIQRQAGKSGAVSARIKIVTGQTRQVLRQARAAMVASGTATLETALMGCPMIVVYKTSVMTYFFGRMLVKVPHIGMVNIVANRLVCPEFIQRDATAEKMAAALKPLIDETSARADMINGLREVSGALGEGGAADRAAVILLAEIA